MQKSPEPVATNDLTDLLREGKAALIAGDSYTARQRFRSVLDHNPEQVEAWIGLAGSVRPYREKREHLLRALAIDPDHAEAQTTLSQVEARLAAGEVLAPGGVREPVAATALPEPPAVAPSAPRPGSETLFCYIHPGRETGLRCTSCDRPICGACATRAAVGQLCPECAKARRPVNYQVSAVDLLIGGTISLFYSAVITFLGLQVLGAINFFGFIVALLLGPVLGDLLVRIVGRATKQKRGRAMQLVISGCYALGAMPLFGLLLLIGGPGALFSSPVLALLLFTVVAISTALARLR